MQGVAGQFMSNVAAAAADNGISYSSLNVFVTGNSEGGFVAEVVTRSQSSGAFARPTGHRALRG